MSFAAVPARSCRASTTFDLDGSSSTSQDLSEAELLITPYEQGVNFSFSYTPVARPPLVGGMFIQACNATNSDQPASTTRFTVMAIPYDD